MLEGSGETLDKTTCVFFESYEENCSNFNYSASDLRDIFLAAGFKIYALKNEQLCSIPKNYTSMQCENLLAIRSEDEFLQRTGYKLTQ